MRNPIHVHLQVSVLACKPYKRMFDFALAVGCQLIFVCIFIGGIIVRLYEDIANGTGGSPELAYRFLGLRSSEEAVVLMICVAFTMLVMLAAQLCIEAYMYSHQQRLVSKWSICLFDPPSVKWQCRGLYASFLSHYKMEAASDARYSSAMEIEPIPFLSNRR